MFHILILATNCIDVLYTRNTVLYHLPSPHLPSPPLSSPSLTSPPLSSPPLTFPLLSSPLLTSHHIPHLPWGTVTGVQDACSPPPILHSGISIIDRLKLSDDPEAKDNFPILTIPSGCDTLPSPPMVTTYGTTHTHTHTHTHSLGLIG